MTDQTNLASVESQLFGDITLLIREAKGRAAQHLNAELTELYWQIGHRLALVVLGGQRANYGKQVLVGLAKRLTEKHGRGWSAKQL